MFHVGQQVVCVASRWPTYYHIHCDTLPKHGSIYTVRATVTVCGELGLFLEEIINPPSAFTNAPAQEQAFHCDGFRPVKQTSIEIFRQILVSPPKSPVREDA